MWMGYVLPNCYYFEHDDALNATFWILGFTKNKLFDILFAYRWWKMLLWIDMYWPISNFVSKIACFASMFFLCKEAIDHFIIDVN